ncbi:tetratricopeptide repeat protein [Bizionia argentinensis JUB59]|uniref:Tetratricopeptide repeat protein n=1 Tax=Bizionia argentinensis JUB59 TaxID=1046627 RepID=G2EG69_9FLAO|nr:tetratricopeptide repeat protein [Bizionia argentinensis]EGV42582.1 tetratricopeptide repeat protein [Bizionia argentinensis JUB59]
MLKKTVLSLIFMLGVFLNGYAQQSEAYTNHLVDYQKALALYNNGQFQAAQMLFKELKKTVESDELVSDCDYYVANCAVRLNQRNADKLIEDFVENHPTSTKRNSAFLDVADYYFSNGKYAYAKKWYDRVDENSLSRNERDKFSFNNGYVAFSIKDFKTARKYLSRVENSKEYGSQAKYYIGFMAYETDDYQQANTYFDQVSDQQKYQENLSYYQADLNFKLGNFDEAIKLAKAQLPKSNRDEISELDKIIGESYFNQKKYAEAIPFLTDYQGTKGKWNNTDYYQLGYAYYKQGDFDKAISEFNKIIDGNNSVAQNAYYHLGESYIKLNKKQEALNAFRNASQMDFDLKIQEDAWLNYAKISYEIGNPYQSIPQVITTYLEKYPNTAHKEEIEILLIDSYITSKNYQEALTLLEGKRSFASKEAYQKVTFYRGLELYNEGSYKDAKLLFDKSIKEAINEAYTARATFWKAETDYSLSNYNEALVGFRQFQQFSAAQTTPEYKNSDYNIAYTYFKQRNYTKSSELFNKFIKGNNLDPVRLNDAYLRLGDAHFVSSNYSAAIKAYEKAVNMIKVDADYAFFQKTLSEGYEGKASEKISGLEEFIAKYPKSTLRDDAMFELGNSYIKVNKPVDAMKMYDRLSRESPKSAFVPKALLRQGLVHYNASRNDQALDKFKTVASNYPNTAEANQAVSTVRLIYIDLGRVNEYASWVQTLDYVAVTDADLDIATYESAEKKYLDNKTDDAIKQFNGYLNQFPKGLNSLPAHFYVAQLYFKKDLKENAMPHYQAVINKNSNEFTEESLSRLSQIYLDIKDWSEAIPVLKRLEKEARFPQNVVYAQSNLMKANYQLNKYDEAVSYAEKVLQQSKIDNKITSDAYVIIARSAMKTNDESRAKTAYAEVEKTATGETAAEAFYFKAYFENKDGKHEVSNVTIQKLAKDFSGYKYYSAKGLILMAKNYHALNDAFQATYILESVIENFKDYKDVVVEAQSTLTSIKAEQAKTNASVQEQEPSED